jgi:hypothetical protein
MNLLPPERNVWYPLLKANTMADVKNTFIFEGGGVRE